MPRFLRAFLAVVAGLVLGSALNYGLIMISGSVIPLPPGTDTSTPEGLQAALPLFEPKHFLFPFLAHALGTLLGALVAGVLAGKGSVVPSYVVGGFFLMGGIASVLMLPSPLWFGATDLLLAYLPMAWLGSKLAARISRGGSAA